MEFFGVVGEKLSHSLSPKIHKKILELIGIEGAYKTFEIAKEDIKNLGDALKLLNIKGVNVTIPYKEVVMRQLDEISEEAKKIGAINTILVRDNKLYGDNTDYFGFKKMLEINNIKVFSKSCVVLGNGGAAKAIITYLIDEGVKEIYLVTRDKSKKINFDSKKIKVIDYTDLKLIKGDVIINTTPVGMYPKGGVSPVDKNIIENFDVLVDIIYNPKITEFLKLGIELNKKVCGGLYMLVGQAVKAEEVWNGITIDNEVINKIYDELKDEFK